MNNRACRALLSIGILVAVAGAFALGRVYPSSASEAPAEVRQAASPSVRFAPSVPTGGGGGGPAGLPDFREVAQRVIPTVVTVRSQRTVRAGNQGFPFSGGPFGDDFFERFFGVPGPRGPQNEQRYVQRGLGSGVVATSDGYILTNNHVVEKVDKVEVVANDGRTLTAKIIGTDPQTDIAVLKVAADGLKPIEMGDSDSLEVGEWVLAVGNPFSEQLGHTVTAGIVSAKGRSNLQLADYEDFIQTDAAINPGNSGGALVNTKGQLVGINAAIISGSGGYQGIGFAIPIKMARAIMDQLIHGGRVVRGWLGLSIQDLTPELAEGIGLPGQEGALIAEVQADSPAAEAGLKRGDVITRFEGQNVKGNSDLRNRVAAQAPGTKADLVILRDGKERTVQVTLGELPGTAARAGAGGAAPIEETLGIQVRSLSPQLAGQLGYEGDSGVVIVGVEPGTAADEAGLQQGDLVKEVNRRAVASVAEYREALAGVTSGKVVVLLVRRGDRVNYVTLRP